MAHMMEKWSDEGKGTEKWHKRDSRRKDELITGHRIQMNIYDRQNEVRGKIYSEMLKKRYQKSSTRLCDGAIVRKMM